MSRCPTQLLLAAALAVAGCVTPSIPIPPPSPENMTFEVDDTGGSASFEYGPDASYASATVYVFNRTRGVGVIDTARENGSVGPTAPFPGVTDDEIVVTFERDGELGATCVRLAAGPSSSGRECDP
jgi:hypothetical protein